jgi:hypothetical protein
MPKDRKSKKGVSGGGKETPSSKRVKKARDDKALSPPDSSSELEAVKTKKGEPANHLRQRAEWFQKRH